MSARNRPEDWEDMNEYSREYLPDCPNCGHGFVLELALFLDPETDEVDGRVLQCTRCWHEWESWKNKPVQTTVALHTGDS